MTDTFTPQWTFRDDGHWWDDLNGCRDDDPVFADWEDDVAQMILFDGYCACGSPERMVDAMVALLREARLSEHGFHHTQLSTDLDLALAYWADRQGLTEHGGSVYGAWITPAGHRWLELVEVLENPQGPSPRREGDGPSDELPQPQGVAQ